MEEGLGNARNEVLADLHAALEKIDFTAYNPNSADFNNALNIGLMWLVLCKVGGMGEAESSDTHGGNGERGDDISEELSGAKRYLQKYIESGDGSFREMATDELRHAGILIKKANARLPTGEEKARLKSYESEMREIAEQVERA